MPSEAFEGIVALLREQRAPDAAWPERRAGAEAAAEAMPPPQDVSFDEVHAGGVPSEWVEAPGASHDRAILYIHGGAYIICSPRTHRRLTAALSREAKTRVLAIDYRLAPEHPFPAAIDDCIDAYKWLLQRTPSNAIALAGDSAGGGLVMATLIRARDEGLPLPACAVVISPWVDLELSGDAIATKRDLDPMLDAGRLKESADLYLDGADARGPLASPIHADLHGLPPLFIHVGTNEILVDDATRLEQRAKADGVDVTLEIEPDMIHVWHIFAGLAPESDAAVKRVAEFVRTRMT